MHLRETEEDETQPNGVNGRRRFKLMTMHGCSGSEALPLWKLCGKPFRSFQVRVVNELSVYGFFESAGDSTTKLIETQPSG
jgi:hypothetical protein